MQKIHPEIVSQHPGLRKYPSYPNFDYNPYQMLGMYQPNQYYSSQQPSFYPGQYQNGNPFNAGYNIYQHPSLYPSYQNFPAFSNQIVEPKHLTIKSIFDNFIISN